MPCGGTLKKQVVGTAVSHVPSNGDVAIALATLLFATVAIAAARRVLDALPFGASMPTIAAYG